MYGISKQMAKFLDNGKGNYGDIWYDKRQKFFNDTFDNMAKCVKKMIENIS
jgi:hypothetical protein